MVLISFGCASDILFESLNFSFGKSFLTGLLQAVAKSTIVRNVKTWVGEKYFFIVQIVIEVFIDLLGWVWLCYYHQRKGIAAGGIFMMCILIDVLSSYFRTRQTVDDCCNALA